MAGRPKIHPEGTTATDLSRMSLAIRKADGRVAGKVLLSRACRDALDEVARVVGDRSRTATVERLAREALARLRSPDRAPD